MLKNPFKLFFPRFSPPSNFSHSHLLAFFSLELFLSFLLHVHNQIAVDSNPNDKCNYVSSNCNHNEGEMKSVSKQKRKKIHSHKHKKIGRSYSIKFFHPSLMKMFFFLFFLCNEKSFSLLKPQKGKYQEEKPSGLISLTKFQ